MANIRIDLDTTLIDGQSITFRSPVSCAEVTGLIVYYPDGSAVTSREFQFADAHGNNVGDIDHLFAENVLVKVILDTDLSRAYVQNADTNSYLENHLTDKSNPHGVTAEQLGALPSSGGTMSGDINMNNNRITYLPEPTGNQQPATKNYVDTRKKTATCTLAKSTAWVDNVQTVSVTGVTASNTVIVAPQASYFNNYRNWGVRCTAQGAGTLTFGCEITPTAALKVNVLILE